MHCASPRQSCCTAASCTMHAASGRGATCDLQRSRHTPSPARDGRFCLQLPCPPPRPPPTACRASTATCTACPWTTRGSRSRVSQAKGARRRRRKPPLHPTSARPPGPAPAQTFGRARRRSTSGACSCRSRPHPCALYPTAPCHAELKVKYFDTIPPCSSLCLSRKGFLFAAAEFGDHALYQLAVSGGVQAASAAASDRCSQRAHVGPGCEPLPSTMQVQQRSRRRTPSPAAPQPILTSPPIP